MKNLLFTIFSISLFACSSDSSVSGPERPIRIDAGTDSGSIDGSYDAGLEADSEFAFCGDDFVQEGEACDDGNTIDGDGCSEMCEVEFCGDGVVNNEDEECDDGNTDEGDGCSALCVTEFCGDGIINNSESCYYGDNDFCAEDCEDIVYILDCPIFFIVNQDPSGQIQFEDNFDIINLYGFVDINSYEEIEEEGKVNFTINIYSSPNNDFIDQLNDFRYEGCNNYVEGYSEEFDNFLEIIYNNEIDLIEGGQPFELIEGGGDIFQVENSNYNNCEVSISDRSARDLTFNCEIPSWISLEE